MGQFQPAARIPHAAGDWRRLENSAMLAALGGLLAAMCVYRADDRNTPQRLVTLSHRPDKTCATCRERWSAATESGQQERRRRRCRRPRILPLCALAGSARVRGTGRATGAGAGPRLSDSHELKREVGHRWRPLGSPHRLKCLSAGGGVSSSVTRSPGLVGIQVAAAALEG
jgi:hypothetical protein